MNKLKQYVNEVVCLKKLEKVRSRYCPSCEFLVSQLEINSHRFDLDCPKCGEYKHSEFRIAEYEE